MQEVFNWFLDHYELLIAAISLVGSLIIFIIKKKPLNSIDCDIYYHCIAAVLLAEAGNKKGQDKKEAAIEYVLGRLQSTYPKLDVAQYVNYISKVIERILSTPQKKGE